MRVAFFGNVVNCLYQIAVALRESGDIEPHLYVSSEDPITARPESVDPELAGNYPAWIHEGNWITPSAVLAPWRAPITRELQQYDLVVVSGPGPIFAQFAQRPWCWWVSGGDLTVKPFPITFLGWHHGVEHKVGELIGGAWQRRAARRATQLWVQPFTPITDALQRLKVPPTSVSTRYFPLVVDTEEFDPDRAPSTDPSPELRRVQDAPFVVFHPSRMVFRPTAALQRAGQLKRNDILLEGFARFVLDGGGSDALLVIPDITLSRDLPAAKELVRQLDIENQVLWATPPMPSGFPLHDLLDLYQASDVVVDDFGAGWFGYVALEGAAMGKPVVTHVDDRVMDQLYSDGHPFCRARTPDDVAEWFTRLAADPAEREKIGSTGRDWVVRHHSPAAARQHYVEAFRSALTDLGRA